MKAKISTLQLIIVGLLGLEVFQKEILILILLFGFVLMTTNKKSIKITSELVILIACFTFNYLILLLKGKNVISGFSIIRSWGGPIMAYIIGYLITNHKILNLEKLIKVISFSYLIHGVLNLISTNTFSMSSRYANSFWNGALLTATLQTTYFVMAIAIAVFWINYKNMKYKFWGVGVILIVIYNAMLTSSRTPLFLTGVMLVVSYIIKQYSLKKNCSFLKKTIKMIIGIFCIGVLLIIIYNMDLFNVKTIFENSFLGQRLLNIEREESMSRHELWIEAFCFLVEKPLGYESSHYAHNMWLDLGKETGILPFSLLVLYTISVMKTLLRGKIKKIFRNEDTILIIYVYMTLMTVFMIEPILQGAPFLFIVFCMINGGIASIKYI